MPDSSSTFATTSSADGRTLALRGDLDERSRDALASALQPLEATGGTINLSGVSFLASSAVGRIVAAQKRAREAGVEIRVVAAEYSVASSTFRVTGLPFEHA